MAVVKTVYVLTYAQKIPAVQALANWVSEKLAASTEAASSTTRAEVVLQVRNFWNDQWPESEPSGRKWRQLVAMAHIDTGPVASGLPYDQVVQQLEDELAIYVCAS